MTTNSSTFFYKIAYWVLCFLSAIIIGFVLLGLYVTLLYGTAFLLRFVLNPFVVVYISIFTPVIVLSMLVKIDQENECYLSKFGNVCLNQIKKITHQNPYDADGYDEQGTSATRCGSELTLAYFFFKAAYCFLYFLFAILLGFFFVVPFMSLVYGISFVLGYALNPPVVYYVSVLVVLIVFGVLLGLDADKRRYAERISKGGIKLIKIVTHQN